MKELLQHALVKLTVLQELEAQNSQLLQKKCPLNFYLIANVDNKVLLYEYSNSETTDEDDVENKSADDVDQATAAKLARTPGVANRYFIIYVQYMKGFKLT